jgi:hypothetical protein
MCDPISIGAGVLMAGSVAANSAAQSKINKARQGAMEAERIRQRGYQSEADVTTDTSQGRYKNFEQGQQNTAQNLGSFLQSYTQPSTQIASAALPTSTSNVVNLEQEKQLGKAQDYSNQQAQSLGNLRSFGEYLGGITRDRLRDTGQLGMLKSLQMGSQSVLPYELEAANNKGSGLQTAGQIMGGLGTIGMLAGLSGAWGKLMAPATATAATPNTASILYTGAKGSAPLIPSSTAFSPYVFAVP